MILNGQAVASARGCSFKAGGAVRGDARRLSLLADTRSRPLYGVLER